MKTLHYLKPQLVLLAFLCISFSSFSQSNKRMLSDFNSIKINGFTAVHYTLGTENSVSVEPSDMSIEDVVTNIEDGTLSISYKKSMDAKSKILITSKNLEQIHAKGASKFISESEVALAKLKIKAEGAPLVQMNLKVDDLTVNAEGAPSIDLKGSAAKMTVKLDGATSLNALDLVATDATITVNGASKANVNVKNELNGKVNGLGNISFKEEPLKKNITKKDFNFMDEDGIIENIHHDKDKPGDTTQIKLGNKKITIIDDNDINGTKKETHKKRSSDKFNGHFAGIELGVNGYLSAKNTFDVPAGYDYLKLKYEKSINVNFNFFDINFNLIKNHFGLVTGLGFQFNNYVFDKSIIVNPDSGFFYGYKDGATDRTNFKNLKSKLVVNYLTVPLFFEYQTNNKSKCNSFHIGAGGELGIRVGTYFKHTFESNDQFHLMKISDDFYVNDIKLDAMVRVGWSKLNLYATYSLLPLFKDFKGPQLYPFTVGVSLGGW
ncbi:MAG: DUF2807 domain-containing protein [Bacteroidota bacterium]